MHAKVGDMIAIMLNDAAYGDDWARHPTAGHHFTDERFLSSFRSANARRKRNKRIRMQNDRRVMQEQEDFDAREHTPMSKKPSWW